VDDNDEVNGAAPADEAKPGKSSAWARVLPQAAVAFVGVVAGLVAGLLIFRWPGDLPADWGDLPTWILAIGATIGGAGALIQLHYLRNQLSDEAKRNVQRDRLLVKQLAEAEMREMTGRRAQAEFVEVSFDGEYVEVINGSARPIRDVVGKVMSDEGRGVLAVPGKYGTVSSIRPGAFFFDRIPSGECRMCTLRPAHTAGFGFPPPEREPQAAGEDVYDEKEAKAKWGGNAHPDEIAVAWFTDDAGYRWQLDEFQHLVQASDESEYQR
jgi:hypothetical protein